MSAAQILTTSTIAANAVDFSVAAGYSFAVLQNTSPVTIYFSYLPLTLATGDTAGLGRSGSLPPGSDQVFPISNGTGRITLVGGTGLQTATLGLGTGDWTTYLTTPPLISPVTQPVTGWIGAAISAPSQGSNVIVTATTGFSIVVFNYTLLAAADQTVAWYADTSPLTGAMPMFQGAGASPTSLTGLFTTGPGQALNIVLGNAGARVAGHLTYALR